MNVWLHIYRHGNTSFKTLACLQCIIKLSKVIFSQKTNMFMQSQPEKLCNIPASSLYPFNELEFNLQHSSIISLLRQLVEWHQHSCQQLVHHRGSLRFFLIYFCSLKTLEVQIESTNQIISVLMCNHKGKLTETKPVTLNRFNFKFYLIIPLHLAKVSVGLNDLSSYHG